MKPLIEFSNVIHRFGTVTVLDDFSFQAGKNEIIGIMGPSGVGKSSFLKIIAGIISPTSGTIIRNTKDIGYCFQSSRLLPWRTALENVSLPLIAKHVKKKSAIAKAYNTLALVGLEGFENCYPNELSGGMKQRVCLARAFCRKPELLLLDEPLSALDHKLKGEMKNLIKNLIKTSKPCVFFISHSQSELSELAERFFIFQGMGKVEKKGSI